MHDGLAVLHPTRSARQLAADRAGHGETTRDTPRRAQVDRMKAAMGVDVTHRRISLVASIVYAQRHVVQIKKQSVPIALVPSA